MKNLIEKRSIEIITSVIHIWECRFKDHSYIFDELIFNNSNYEIDYFSEVEMYIWENSNIIGVLSIILYLNGKQLIPIEELERYTNNELEIIFSKIVRL